MKITAAGSILTGAWTVAASLTACFGANTGSAHDRPLFDGGALDAEALLDGADVDTGPNGLDASPLGGFDAAPAPVFDAGPGCNAPLPQSSLSPVGEGLPASGLVLWLRADRGVYTAAPDAGAADAGDGPAVCAWVDQSGSSTALANLSLTQPTWVTTGLGGRPAVHFIGGTEQLQTSGVLGIGAASPRTLVAVEELVNGDGRFQPIVQGGLGTAGTYIAIDANTYGTAGNREGIYMTSNAFDTATSTSTSSARVHVYTVSAMTPGMPIAGSVDYRVNGVTQTLTHLAGGSDGTFIDFSGANFTAVGTSFTSSTGVPPNALVAEVLVYDRALDVTERAAVEVTLEARYGIH